MNDLIIIELSDNISHNKNIIKNYFKWLKKWSDNYLK